MARKKLQVGIVGRQRMGARDPIHFLNRTPRAKLTATSTSNANEMQRAKKHLVPYGVTTVQTLRRDAQAQRLASRRHCLRGHRTRKASHQNHESQQLHSVWKSTRGQQSESPVNTMLGITASGLSSSGTKSRLTCMPAE